MAAILDDADIEDGVVASQDAALDRLLSKDFGGTLLRFVDQVRATPPRPAPEVPYDFWADVRTGGSAGGAASVQAGCVSSLADGPRTGPRTSDFGSR